MVLQVLLEMEMEMEMEMDIALIEYSLAIMSLCIIGQIKLILME
jgi:hypothetical protein